MPDPAVVFARTWSGFGLFPRRSSSMAATVLRMSFRPALSGQVANPLVTLRRPSPFNECLDPGLERFASGSRRDIGVGGDEAHIVGTVVERIDGNRVVATDRHSHHRLNARMGFSAAFSASGIAPKRIVTGYGFWIFLLSDIITFSAFFAAFAVVKDETGAELFDVGNVKIETGLPLAPSFTCGMASLAAEARRALLFHAAMVATFLLG